MNGSNVSPQLIAALLAGRRPPGMAPPPQPGPLFSQPMGRDPVAAMRGVMGGAAGIGGGGAGLLGGLDPMKLAQLSQMLNQQQYTGTGGAGMAQPGSTQFAGTGGLY
jgi:hypothetical protein